MQLRFFFVLSIRNSLSYLLFLRSLCTIQCEFQPNADQYDAEDGTHENAKRYGDVD